MNVNNLESFTLSMEEGARSPLTPSTAQKCRNFQVFKRSHDKIPPSISTRAEEATHIEYMLTQYYKAPVLCIGINQMCSRLDWKWKGSGCTEMKMDITGET